MESNEQTELTCKTEIDSQVGSRMTAKGWGGDGGIELKGKRTHGHEQFFKKILLIDF